MSDAAGSRGNPEAPVKKNQVLELTIESLAYGGKGVARLDNFVIFIKNALPGQTVEARIIKRRSAWAEAVILRVIRKSDMQVEAPCPYFSDCGGCSFQNLDYAHQLLMKKQQVEDVYRHLTHIGQVVVKDVLASPVVMGYRNKMEFSAGDSRWIRQEGDDGSDRDFAIGLHAPGRFDKVLDIDRCLLQADDANQIYHHIRDWARQNCITLNNPRKHTGFLRNVMIRRGEHSGEIMVNLITRTEDRERLQPLADSLLASFPSIASIMNNVTASLGMQSRGEKEICLAGNPVIHDRIGSIDYEISPNSFFQTNTKGAEQLYDVVRNYARSQENPVIWDFYSGTGSIALYLADSARKVYGFEVVADAVKNANANALRNGRDNCEFFEADLDRFLQKNQDLIASLQKPDIAIIDPPRAGIHPKFLQQLVNLAPPRIIYVSCNPSTQARDIEAFLEAGYAVEELQPVDMFPHTWHIESVALLTRPQV